MSRDPASTSPPNHAPPIWVSDDAGVRALAEQLLRAKAIAVDTEGNSMHAYRERLCLMQISADGQDWLVDTLLPLDVECLVPVFEDPAIRKVLHDAEFDILMLKRAWSMPFAGVFDTKVAACSLGIEGVGLAAMLERFFGVRLDKRLQRSDWGKRPLTAEQLEYARCDTRWLVDLAYELEDLLYEGHELHWLEVDSECRRLEALNPQPRARSEDGWMNLVGARRLDPQAKAALAQLWRMREEVAQARDVPPFKILEPSQLMALAQARPADETQLAAVPAVPATLRMRHGRAILTALASATTQRRSADAPNWVAPSNPEDELRPRAQRVMLSLRKWRKEVAERRRSDASLVLHKGVMLELAQSESLPQTLDDLAATGLLEPWRLAHYGTEILAALRG